MKFNIFPYKLTGNPDPSGWVSVHDFTPASQDLASKKGRLIAIVSMIPTSTETLPKGEDLISKEIFTRIHETYFNSDGSPLDLLKKGVVEVAADFTSPSCSLQVLVCVNLNNHILFAATGKVQSWVLRGGQLARIVSSGNVPQAVAGNLVNKDLFYIGTDSFFDKVTPEILKNPGALKSEDVKGGGSLGVVILKVEEEEEKIRTEIQVPIRETNLTPIPKSISPVRLAAAGIIDQILNILPKQKLYIKEDLGEIKENKKRKVATSAGAILLVLLLVSIIFGVRQQKISVSQSKYAGILSAVQHDLDEAQSLSAVDAKRARSLVLDANSQMQGLLSQKIKDERITKLAANVANAMGAIAGLYNDAPSMYLDLTLQTSGFKGDDMAASENRAVILDKAGKRLISVDLDTSKTATVAGPDIMPNANFVSAYSDINYVTANDGVWSVGDKAEPVIKSEWGNSILPYAYTGNFYILDKANGVVDRYQSDGGAFGSKANWLAAGIKPDLSNVTAWTIDGNIWMLTADGNILRFSSGNPIDFSLTDTDKAMKAIDIFTTQDSNFLYILDSGNGRILVIDKNDGTTKAQYVSDNIKNAKKIVVSEADKKMILLEGDKLFSLDIKHL